MKYISSFLLNSKKLHFTVALISVLQFPLFFWRFDNLFRKSGAITYFGITFLVFLSVSLIVSQFKPSLYLGRAALILFLLLCLALLIGIDQRSYMTKTVRWRASTPMEEGTNPLTLRDPAVIISFLSHPDLSIEVCSGKALQYLMNKGEDGLVEAQFEIAYDFGKIVSIAAHSLDGYPFCDDYSKDNCPPDRFPVDCLRHNGLSKQGLSEADWFDPFEETEGGVTRNPAQAAK